MAGREDAASQPDPMLVMAALGEAGERSGLLAALEAMLAGCPATAITCDVSDLDATLDTIEALARLQLIARRRDGRLQLRNVEHPLEELIALVCRRDTLPSYDSTEHRDA
jgi:hypothetical protein